MGQIARQPPPPPPSECSLTDFPPHSNARRKEANATESANGRGKRCGLTRAAPCKGSDDRRCRVAYRVAWACRFLGKKQASSALNLPQAPWEFTGIAPNSAQAAEATRAGMLWRNTSAIAPHGTGSPAAEQVLQPRVAVDVPSSKLSHVRQQSPDYASAPWPDPPVLVSNWMYDHLRKIRGHLENFSQLHLADHEQVRTIRRVTTMTALHWMALTSRAASGRPVA